MKENMCVVLVFLRLGRVPFCTYWFHPQISSFCLNSGIRFHCVYLTHFHYFSVDGHLGYSLFLL